MNLFSHLEANARRFGERAAVFHGERQVATWRELRDRAAALGSALAAAHPVGSRVVIVSKNCPEYLELLFACWHAGQVVVPLNAKLHPREIEEIVAASGAVMVFASATLAAKLNAIGPVIVGIGSPTYIQMMDTPPCLAAQQTLEAPAWLFYTSGTTGKSKGAVLTGRNLQTMVLAHLADFEMLGERDAIVHAAPMSHGSGLYALPYVARAARHVIPTGDGFDPGEFLDLCGHHRAVGAFLAPTMLRRLIVEIEVSGREPLGIRNILYGGAPMYLDDLQRAVALLGPRLTQLYGQGEAPMSIAGLTQGDHVGADDAQLGSVGWPRSGIEIAIRDAGGEILPAGQVGEVTCRGDVVMAGYWNDPAATTVALRDGWLLTGDMGMIDETGRLTLRDRSKDVIISGGSNIYPREVEDALLSCPGVAEVCVVGEVHADWGEIVVAFVVAEAGQNITSEGLDGHCLERIARFKRPKRYEFLEALPKSSYGKVLKRELAARLACAKAD